MTLNRSFSTAAWLLIVLSALTCHVSALAQGLENPSLNYQYQPQPQYSSELPQVSSDASGAYLPAGPAEEYYLDPHSTGCPDECNCHLCSNGKHRIPLWPYWENGLRVISDDEAINLHFGGNVQWDSVWLNSSDEVLGAPASNATSTRDTGASLLRRARFKFDGTIYEVFEYSLEFDMANAVNENKGLQNPTQDNVAGSPFPCNVWMQLRDVPIFRNVRIGNQVKPIGMTNNTYQGFLPFMERADNMDAFYGPFDEGFDPGVAALGWSQSERMAWRYGIYRPLRNSAGIAINNYTVAGRITTLPVDADEGCRLVHLGFSASQGSLVNDEFRIRARPALRNGPGYAVPIVVDTGDFPGSTQFLFGPELAAVVGPLTFQSEWYFNYFNDVPLGGAGLGTAFFHGGYAQVLYFLTGENQEYERREGVFGRVVPFDSVRFGRGGRGAWQVGFRISYLDLTHDVIDGGQVADMTFGINWFLNSNMKIQGNYILADRQGPQGQGDGWFNGLGVRAAFDF